MNSLALQIVLYGFVAAASPIALGSTLVVLGSRGGRWNGLAFAVGVVVGQVAVCGLAYALGTAALPVGHHAHDMARAVLELALGIAMLGGGAYVRAQSAERPVAPDSRTKAVLGRLAHLNLPSVLAAGALLTLGPKRLALTVLVTATISAAELGDAAAVGLTFLYVVLATALVTVPVVLAIVFGPRAQTWMTDVQAWLAAHRRPLTFYPLTVLGFLVTIDALLALLR